MVGATVLTGFTNSIMPTGIYQDSLIMNAYADGIYFAQLKLGNRKSIMKKIIKSTAAGIKENNRNEGKVKFYPIPFLNELTIENINSNIVDKKKIIITNTFGQTVYTTEFYQNGLTIELLDLENGIYFIQLYINNQLNFRNKLIK